MQQDDVQEAITKLQNTIQQAHKVNSKMIFEVFIHKVDGISDDHKISMLQKFLIPFAAIQRDIQQRVTDDLQDHNLSNIPIRYHLTSIYDHSIFEAFSKVIQKLIPQLPYLENLLDMLVSVRCI